MNNTIFMVIIFFIGVFLYVQNEHNSKYKCTDENLANVYKYLSMMSAGFMAASISYFIWYFQCGSALQSNSFAMELYVGFFIIIGCVLIYFGIQLKKSKFSKQLNGSTILASGIILILSCVGFLGYKNKFIINNGENEASQSYSF